MNATVTQRSKCDITIGSSHDIYPVSHRFAHVTQASGTGVSINYCLGAVPKHVEALEKYTYIRIFVSTNIGIFGVDADADKNADAVWGLCRCIFQARPYLIE